MDAYCADLRRAYEYQSGSVFVRILAVLRTPGVHAVTVLRFGQWLKSEGLLVRICLDPVYALLQLLIQILWGIDLPRSAKIGRGLYVGHFGGITVSRNSVIGEYCNLSQDVTIGGAGRPGKQGYPTIGDGVYIAPGARIIGPIRIGNNVKIGANAVVHRDIPDNAVVALHPGFKIISFEGNRRQPAKKHARET